MSLSASSSLQRRQHGDAHVSGPKATRATHVQPCHAEPCQVNIGAVEQAYDQVEHTRDLLQQEQVLRMVRSSVSSHRPRSFRSLSVNALSVAVRRWWRRRRVLPRTWTRLWSARRRTLQL